VLVGVLVATLLHATGYFQPIENLVSTVLAPLQYSFHWISARIGVGVQTLRDLSSLQARVLELEGTIDRLMIENVRLREAEIELADLRQQLNFKRANPTYDLLAAEVIGRDPSNLLHYIVIDRGTQDGIVVGMPVVTARGLVGRVTSAYPQSARVILITDLSSSVNALIQSSRATGLIQGQGRQKLLMRYVEQGEQVEIGDIVLTSGLGGNFPKRLVIGQVAEVKSNNVDMFQEVWVESAVDFDRLEMVLVVLGFASTD